MRRHRVISLAPVLVSAVVLAGCAPDGDPRRLGLAPDTTVAGGAGSDDDEPSESASTVDDNSTDDDAAGDESTDDLVESADESAVEDDDGDDDDASDDDTTESATTTTIEDTDDEDVTVTTQAPTSNTVATTTTPPTTAPSATTAPPTTTTPPTTAPPTTTIPPNTPPPDPNATAATALAGFNSLIAEVDVVDGLAELALCPADPSGAYLDDVFSSIAGGIFAPAYESVTAPLLVEIDDYGIELTCERFDETGEIGLGFRVIGAPDDLQQFSEDFANPDGIDGITVTVTPAGSGSGGDFFQVCSDDTDEPVFSYCEVDWIADGLMVTAWAAGAQSSAVDLDVVQAALESRLSLILTDLTNAPN